MDIFISVFNDMIELSEKLIRSKEDRGWDISRFFSKEIADEKVPFQKKKNSKKKSKPFSPLLIFFN